MANRPQLCGNCGKLMGIDDNCPYCGVSRHDPRQMKRLIKNYASLGTGPVAMRAILVSNLLLYFGPIVFYFLSTQGAADLLTMLWKQTPYHQVFGGAIYSTPLIRTGYFWGLFSANFLHLNLLHLLFNSYALYVLSPQLEDEMGSKDFFIFYILAGIGGFTLSALSGNSSGGASAALFGLIAAHIFIPLARGDQHKGPMFQVAIQWAAFSFVFGIAMGADNFAHGGGFFFGGLLSYIWVLINKNSFYRTLSLFLALALLVLSVLSFALPFSQKWL